jgi:hypothetical protein
LNPWKNVCTGTSFVLAFIVSSSALVRWYTAVLLAFVLVKKMVDMQAGKKESVLEDLNRAPGQESDSAEVYYDRGTLYMQSGERELALKDLSRAIKLNPDLAKAWANRGALYMQSAERDSALKDLNRAIELNPQLTEALANRGILYMQSGERELALADLNRAIELNPNFANAYCSRGLLYKQVEENELALADLSKATELSPDLFKAWLYRGVILTSTRQIKPALDSLEKALQLNPLSGEAYTHIGNAFHQNGQPDIALEYHVKALELESDSAEVYHNIGHVMHHLGQYEAAIESYDRAIELNQYYALASGYSKSHSLMKLGRFDEGLPLLEMRFEIISQRQKKVDIPGKQWFGEEPVQGKTILLYHDSGLGDTIQFCRYARMVSALGAKVVLQVPLNLFGLLKNLEGVDELITEELTLQTIDKYPPFDLYCGVMSLPFIFRTRPETIPGKTPYLYAEPEKIAAWEKRMGPKTKPRVGIVVSGNPRHANDHNRSIMLSQLFPYLPDNFEYISLQQEVRDVDRMIFAAMTEWKLYGEELNDFSDTAALCSLMDVVVSVCTSVAHLSAALGRPTWVMLSMDSCFRWIHGKKETPWYPTMRLYHQNQPGSWRNVLEEVRSDLLKIQF